MRFLITAGPTREPIDPVRYLSNRSSGKMGYALAAAALARGHEVVLVSGPVSISAPDGATLVRVETAQQMYDAVAAAIPGADAAIFCAAVADYRVAEVAGEKIKKTGETLTLTLVKNPDLLGRARSVFGFTGLLVGFAAETDDVQENAAAKLAAKRVDLMVGNDVRSEDSGFEVDTNRAVLLDADGGVEEFGLVTKVRLADLILDRVRTPHPRQGAPE